MGPGHRLGLVVGDGPGVTIRTTADAGGGRRRHRRGPDRGGLDDEAFAALRAEDLSVFGLLYAGLLHDRAGGVRPVRGLGAGAAGAALRPTGVRPDGRRPLRGRRPGPVVRHRRRPGGDGCLPRSDRASSTCGACSDPTRWPRLSDEVERLRAEATLDDRRSWWATGADGADVCCRLTFMGERSTTIADLADDRRLQRPGRPHRPRAAPGTEPQRRHQRGDQEPGGHRRAVRPPLAPRLRARWPRPAVPRA